MRKLPILFALTLVFVSSSFAQTTDGWMRVQTDDGVFSVEVPEKYKYFFSKDGFSVSRNSNDDIAQNMAMFTAYTNKTLISLEVYDASQNVLSKMYEWDKRRQKPVGKNELIGDTKVKTLVREDDEAYAMSKYFRIGKKIFVLLAAAREGRTPEIDRFFNSISITSKSSPSEVGTRFSKLLQTDITTGDTFEAEQSQSPWPKNPTGGDPQNKKLLILRTFNASYVPAARNMGVTGEIRLQVHFGADGFTKHVDVQRMLDGGLLRQTLYAALRIRYLPEIKDGEPIATTRPVIYSFNIY